MEKDNEANGDSWLSRRLRSKGYSYEAVLGIWRQDGQEGISYSDGQAPESYILQTLLDSQDRGPLSDELATKGIDWPSFYHFHRSRDSLLRPFKPLLKNARCVEIGSGCGAITRYLGETCESVLAIEGSPRRARATAARTSDLNNVEVLAENIQDIDGFEHTFDFVVAVGILEYASVYSESRTPYEDLLRKSAMLLRPNGKLLLAIENQLGLKYFAGAQEDHLGRAFAGIENQYEHKGPRTFGITALRRMLNEAGYSEAKIMGAFPDYKFTSLIVTEEGEKDPCLDPHPMIIEAITKDPQFSSTGTFSTTRAWETVCDNKLLISLANSFIVLAARETSAAQPTELAYYMSTSRQRAFCKVHTFTKEDTGDIIVKSDYMLEADRSLPFIKHNLLRTSRYIRGISLEHKFLLGYSVKPHESTRELATRYVEAVCSITGIRSDHLDVDKPHVSGEYLDLIPRNILIDRNTGRYAPIDLEWQAGDPIDILALLYRGLYNTGDRAIDAGTLHIEKARLTEWTVQVLIQGAGLMITEEEAYAYEEQEHMFRALVS